MDKDLNQTKGDFERIRALFVRLRPLVEFHRSCANKGV